VAKRPGDPGHAPGWCIHYRYNRAPKPGENTCEAGVNLDKFHGTAFAARPCFLDKVGQSNPGAETCDHLRRPTEEEMADHEKWVSGRMDRMRTVMVAIRPWRDAHKGRSAAEVVDCPVCAGRLHLSISSYNGHVHGSCETADCVSWME